MMTKSIQKRVALKVFLCFLLFFMVFMTQGFTNQKAEGKQGIFSHVEYGEAAPFISMSAQYPKPTTLRSRYARIDFEEIFKTLDQGREANRVIRFNLFEDVLFTARLERVVHNKSGSITWIGKIIGNTPGSVIFTFKEGILMGNFSLGSKNYSLRYLGGDIHVIKENDHSKYAEGKEPTIINDFDSALFDRHEEDLSRVQHYTTEIDVLVVYTASARSAAGGTTAMNTLIDLAISESNTGYSNSSVNCTLDLAHAAEVTYSETSFDWDTCMTRLVGSSDGYMDNVHTLRNTYYADVVVLIVEDDEWCGSANAIMASSSTAFCIVHRDCATGYYSFAHEIGHLQGARHDRYVDNIDYSPYTYNHGRTYPTSNWRTIMAYNNACAAVYTTCTRINYWSNPSVTYGGVATGISGGAGVGCDNHWCLNNTANIVAHFKEPIDVFPTGDPVWPLSVAPGGAFTANCCIEGYSNTSSVVKYYLSSNSTYDAGDTYLGYDNVGVITTSASCESENFTLPAWVTDGTWYIIFVADANSQITETNENNNIDYMAFTVETPPTDPDLIVYSKSISPSFVEEGERITIYCTIKNQGETTAGSSTLKYYISSNSTYDAGDTYLGSDSVESLTAGSVSSQDSITYTVPQGVGQFYIIFVADANNNVSEENETNNNASYRVLVAL